MRTSVNLALALIVVLSASSASAKNARRPADDSNSEVIRIHVTYGERISEFRLKKGESGGRITYYANSEEPRSRELTIENLNFILGKLRQVPAKLDASDACSRSVISAEASLSS